LGFVSGSAIIAAAWLLVLRHERWKAIRSVYLGSTEGPAHRGNALIWPSR
jgi:hypothetical protein